MERKADGSQILDLTKDALIAAGVDPDRIYEDFASGAREERFGLADCLKSLRTGDILIVWKLDRLGRNVRHPIQLAEDLRQRDIGLKVLAGESAEIDTTTAAGRLTFKPLCGSKDRGLHGAIAA